MRIYRRSKTGPFHCAIKIDGKLERFSTGETQKQEAQLKALEIIQGFAQRKKKPKEIEWHSDLEKFRRARPDLSAHLDLIREHLTGFNKIDYERYREKIIADNRSNSTINKKLLSLQMFVKYLIENLGRTYPTSLKFKLLKQAQSKHYIYKDEQIDRIRAHFKDRGELLMADLILVLRYTGMRLSELLTLKQNNVTNEFIHLYQTKSGKSRAIPISEKIKDLLTEVETYGKLGSASCVSKKFNRIKEAIGLPDEANLHSLRHSFAQTLVDSGTPIEVVSKLLGHSTINVTLIYAKSTDVRMKQAIESIT